LTSARVYGNPHSVAVGAIRWNGVYAETTVLAQENGCLGPNQYHFRAPWWSVAGSNTIAVQGNASTMDAEIDYAAAAKIYWAFFYYGSALTGEMNRAFTLFQASPKKNLVKWCFAWASFGVFNNDIDGNLATIVSLVSQSNYQTVMNGRPLVYLYDDGNGTNSVSRIAAFRAACVASGLANPYIAVMSGSPTQALSIKIANGLDAITTYAYQKNENTTFDVLRVAVEANWYAQLAVSEMIPNCMFGWQPQPRGATAYYDYPIPVQISNHLQSAVNFSYVNCPSLAVIAYAWNEFSEGGWLCPTYVDGTLADTTHLDAAAAVAAR
jgi:hypothetical protein